MQQINWGIIGCGNVTELKSGPAFNKVDGSRVVAVMRRDAEKARDYARRHQVPAWYSSAEDLVGDPSVNAVYVATPPSTHARYAILAMEHGKPVYVEKPMASGYQECQQMQQVAKQTGLPLYVAYYRRFLPYFDHVKTILEKELLGKLLFVQVDFHIPPRSEDFDTSSPPWRILPEIAGAGYFYDLASHQIDLFDWFFGKVREVSGSRFNRRGLYKAEDVVMGHMVYESGLPLAGTWCFAADDSQNEDIIRIFGTKATLEFSTFAFTPVKLISKDGISEELPPNPENIQYGFIRNMVEELQGIRELTDNHEAAMRTQWIMDTLLGKI